MDSPYAAVEANSRRTARWLESWPVELPPAHIPAAETAVLDCLRALQAIPKADRPYADGLMDFIARIFLNSSDSQATARRRAFALLRIAAGSSQ
jgi:hypothetical protein